MEFTVPLQESGGVSAGQAHIGTRQDDHAGKESQVRWKATKSVHASLIKLDDFTRDLELGELTLIKCDTEGAELMVFEGAAGLLERFKPTVILEINPWFMEGFGKKVEQLVELFERRGYRMYRLAEGNDVSLQPVAADKVVEDNYIFIHPKFKDRFSGIE